MRAIGADWTQFSAALKTIRDRGYYVSRGELDASVTGFAAPVFGEVGEIVSSIVVAASVEAPLRMSEESMITVVVQTARELSQRLHLGRAELSIGRP